MLWLYFFRLFAILASLLEACVWQIYHSNHDDGMNIDVLHYWA